MQLTALIPSRNIPSSGLPQSLRTGDSSVGMATVLRNAYPRSQGLIPGRGQEACLFSITSRSLEDRPPSYTMGTRCYFPGNKEAVAWKWPQFQLVPRLKVELYLHSPHVFMAWCLIKSRYNFYTKSLLQRHVTSKSCDSITLFISLHCSTGMASYVNKTTDRGHKQLRN
jgi:hypothetical protein